MSCPCVSDLHCDTNANPDALSGTDISGAAITSSTITGSTISGSAIAGLEGAVDTIAALRAKSVAALQASDVEVLGYYAAGDQGGGLFRYSSSSVLTDNGGTVIAPNSGSGRWLRVYTGSINPRWFGAKGDGTTNDVVAFTAALVVAAGHSLEVSDGDYAVTSEIVYDSTLGPIDIFSNGATLRSSGASNKTLHITGTAGVTANQVRISGLRFNSSTSGVSGAAIHLDGIARFTVKDCAIVGGAKTTYGIRCTAAQQGEIAGCTLIAVNGLFCEASGGVESNAIEVHGCTFDCSTTNAKITADDCQFHSNHLTSAVMNIDVTSVNGVMIIRDNHVEPIGHTNNGMIIRSGTKAVVSGNTFYGYAGSVDLDILSGAGPVRVINNLFNANVTIRAGASDTVFAFNTTGGTCSDSGTRTINLGNRAYSGTAIDGTHLFDQMRITSSSAAGPILDLVAAAVDTHWGMKITGAGSAKDVYVQLQDAIIAGNTGGGIMSIKDGPGGTSWAAFNANGVHGYPMVIGSGAPAAVAAGEVGISGATQSTVGAAGGASALPATPSGYIKINVAGVNRVIPFYPIS